VTVLSFGPWRADIRADGHVTLIDRAGTVVRLRYERDDLGRISLREVHIVGVEGEPLSGRCWRRIPFTALERHLMGGHEATGGPTKCPTLIAPEGRLTEDFFKAMADVYLWVTAAGRHPAPVIAEMVGVPVRRVHRWIYEARKRGLLPPAMPGRAG